MMIARRSSSRVVVHTLSLDLYGLLHRLAQRTILLRSDRDAPCASGFEFDSARGFAALDFAGAFGGGDA